MCACFYECPCLYTSVHICVWKFITCSFLSLSTICTFSHAHSIMAFCLVLLRSPPVWVDRMSHWMSRMLLNIFGRVCLHNRVTQDNDEGKRTHPSAVIERSVYTQYKESLCYRISFGVTAIIHKKGSHDQFNQIQKLCICVMPLITYAVNKQLHSLQDQAL